jgi:hypothetical protein
MAEHVFFYHVYNNQTNPTNFKHDGFGSEKNYFNIKCIGEKYLTLEAT